MVVIFGWIQVRQQTPDKELVVILVFHVHDCMFRIYPARGGEETASTQRTISDEAGCQTVDPAQYIPTAVACKPIHTIVEMLYYDRNVYRISICHDETW